jgi:pimeloyl-ACP methyl ester carboxylesterase
MFFEHHLIERDNLRWHVVTSGPPDAPPVLLLHCWTGNWTLWEKTLEALDGKFRFIVPDHLGFGRSDKPRGDHYGIDKQAERSRFILNHFGCERACVMGHSMGGQIALTLAGMYPETVERLIVVDPAVTGKLHSLATAGLLWMAMVRWGMDGIVEALIRLVLRFPIVGLQLARVYFPRPAAHREAALYWEQQVIADGQLHSAAWAERSIVSWDVTPVLNRITAPTLAIWGVDDYCVPISECAVLERHISVFRALRLPAIGHFPMIEAWPAFSQEITAFLDLSSSVHCLSSTKAVESF